MGDVEYLYSVVDTTRIQIAHSLSCLANTAMPHWTRLGRSAELEFVFLLCLREQKAEASGIVKMGDLNHIFHATCDVINLLGIRSPFRMKGSVQTYFGMGDRPHGTMLASSSLVDLAPRPRFPTRVTKWIFVMEPEGTESGFWWIQRKRMAITLRPFTKSCA